MAFQEKTINQVINPLIKKLQANIGYIYPTLGHFYREIELLKFPYMGNNPQWNYNNGRNVYSQQQYETIYQHILELGLIQVEKSAQRSNAYRVYVVNQNNNPTTTTDSQESTQINIACGHHTIALQQDMLGSNVYEYVLPSGEGLTAQELKVLNNQGFVYHSEQTGIDYETANGVEYMDIYYFAKIKNVEKFFADCLPF
jgi:hypothetical protein